MKKDSFTFSDKLKKSKSLPLSKRIPSRSGGEVKAKRTLFERAQRDLPFIIVAALALLLLPFLSRESVEIDTPSVVWGDGDAYLEDFNQPKSAEGEIALSSFRNPLDLIIRHGDKDSSAKDTIDAYGSGSEESSAGSDYSARSSYSSEDYSSAPATSSYGKTVRRSVRNSINRVPTAIGSLRAGSMVSPGAGSGVGHSMAIGSRSKDAAPKVQGPGVRPVALQPLVASGKGRDLTGGDALYAEAARSIGAMNRPGAKQALLDAQLADVDGKPLGDTKGGPGAGDPNRPGAGGGPSNSWSHNNQKPWWWDMMSDRAQKRWMLWHYNWEKMASDSLIKLTAGLASCLITGSNDFAVNNFLGEPAKSGQKWCCIPKGGGHEICEDEVGDLSVSTSGSGKDKTTNNNTGDILTKMCGENAEWIKMDDSSPRKSALDVRLRCLGMKLSELKAKVQTHYYTDCQEVDSTPMALTVSVTKNGKDKVRKLEKMGYYVVAEKARSADSKIINTTPAGHLEQCDTNRVIFIDKISGTGGRIIIDNDKLLEEYPGYQIKKVVVYKVGKKSRNSDDGLSEATEEYNKMLTYTSEQQKKYNKKHGKNAYETKLNKLQEELAKQQDLYDGRTLNQATKEDVTLTKDLKTVDSTGYFNTQEEVNVTISEEEYESAFTLLRGRIKNKECVTEDFVRYKFKPWKGKLEQVKVCPVAPKLLNVNIDDGKIRNAKCFDNSIANKLTAGEEYSFQADVVKPTRRVLAFVLERYNSGTGYGDWTVVDTFDTQSKEIKLSEEKFLQQDGNTFFGRVTVGMKGQNKPGEDATPGEGKIIWIATEDAYGKAAPILKGASVDPSELFISSAPRQVAVCRYAWGCDKVKGVDVCSQQSGCCLAQDGNAYEAAYLDGESPAAGFPFKTMAQCSVQYTPEELKKLAPCTDLCYSKKAAAYNIEETNIYIAQEPLDNIGADLTQCPVCNPDNGDGGQPVVQPNQTKAKAGTPTGDMTCQEKGTPCPCIEVKEGKVPGTDDPLYVKSGLDTPNAEDNMPEVTPICAKRAKGITSGNIFVRNEDGTAGDQIQPDEDIVTMLLAKEPGDREKLCPFCNDNPTQPADEDVCTPDMQTSIDISERCVVKLIGDYFPNASYKLCSVLPFDLIYNHMKNCKDYVIEGHASKVYTTGDEKNNKRISFDRAMTVANEIRPIWEQRENAKVEITPTSDGRGLYEGVVSDSQWTEGVSWPKRGKRNTLKSPNASPADVTFKLEGVGSRDADPSISRPANWDEGLTKEERAAENQKWFDIERPNRKVIIKGTPKEENK